MKLKNAKICGECRASRVVAYAAWNCEFGFKTKAIKGPPPFSFLRSVPCEPCSKPTTFKEYLLQRDILHRRNQP